MAERAHPDNPGFQDKWQFRLRLGCFPWLSVRKSPYRAAFFWRYQWVSKECGGKDVLDIPCGMGWGTSLIVGAKSLVGIDISAEAIKEANERYSKHAQFRLGDMAALDLPANSIDLVSCLEGIEHVPKQVGVRFLQECHRILRERGLLLLSSPYCRTSSHSGNPYHLHEYQPDEIRHFVSANFEIEDTTSRDVDVMRVLYMKCRKKN